MNPLKKIVSEVAKKRNSEVISLAILQHEKEEAYEYKPQFHRGKSNPQLISSNCQCDYCKALRAYVSHKLEKHRAKKSLENYEEILTNKQIRKWEETINNLSESIKFYRDKKESIKKDLGLTN